MSSTSEALVQLAEQKEQLRQICNRYLAQGDKLAVNCTLQDIIDVFDEYDEYSYMNKLLNSIEVFPDKDYSINDTKGHIKSLNNGAFRGNTGISSMLFTADNFSFGNVTFTDMTNLKKLVIAGTTRISEQECLSSVTALQHFSAPHLLELSSYQVFLRATALISILFGDGTITCIRMFGALTRPSFSAFVLTKTNGIITMTNSSAATDFINNSSAIVYVPSALQTSYASATNWTTINASRPIQDIESHINDLRTLGVDFSYTPYANKKWENGALVTDSTIGEEVDD